MEEDVKQRKEDWKKELQKDGLLEETLFIMNDMINSAGKISKKVEQIMGDIIDNSELEQVLTILESMEDELLAAELLKDFQRCFKGAWSINLKYGSNFSHSEWKKKCDEAKERVDLILEKIKSHA